MQHFTVSVKENTSFKSCLRNVAGDNDFPLRTSEVVNNINLPVGTRVQLGGTFVQGAPVYVLGRRVTHANNDVQTYVAVPVPENPRMVTFEEGTKYTVGADPLGLVKKLEATQKFTLAVGSVVTLSDVTYLHTLDGVTEMTMREGFNITLA